MARCAYCDSLLLFLSTKGPDGKYCNKECLEEARLTSLAAKIPKGALDQLVRQCHLGDCPQCGGSGPVDVHKSHEVWSALILTSWKTIPAISCKRCATKRQFGAVLFSGLLGWWGFPWGIFVTPIQIVRNFVEMLGGPDPAQPSDLLEKLVTLQTTARALAVGQIEEHTPPPLPPQAAPVPASLAKPASIPFPDADSIFKPRD